jgi:hypothetical protein
MVSAHGTTSGYHFEATDLLDAVVKAKKLQEDGVAGINIMLQRLDVPEDYPWAAPSA